MSDINKKEIHLKAFSELKGKIFHIPYQQRGYKWTKSNVEELLNDLREFISCNKESKRVYCLQPLAIVPLGDERYSVIDGQQRLTKPYIFYTCTCTVMNLTHLNMIVTTVTFRQEVNT